MRSRQATTAAAAGPTAARTLKSMLEMGRAALGGWCAIPSPFVAEVMGAAGYDWMCLDMQHGLIDYERGVGMLQALDISGTPTLVRVPWNESGIIMRMLDAGAVGVIVPMVNDGEEARRAADACRYPPHGSRSWGPIRAGMRPGFDTTSSDEDMLCVVMVETMEACERIDEIVRTPGVDAVFIGPQDLRLSQKATDASAATIEPLIDRVQEACRQHDVAVGIFCGSVEDAAAARARGLQLLAVGSDSRMLAAAARASLDALRSETQ